MLTVYGTPSTNDPRNLHMEFWDLFYFSQKIFPKTAKTEICPFSGLIRFPLELRSPWIDQGLRDADVFLGSLGLAAFIEGFSLLVAQLPGRFNFHPRIGDFVLESEICFADE